MEEAQTIIKSIGYTKIFEANRDCKSPVVLNVGGAGSSKSYSIAQNIIAKFIAEDNKSFGIIRKTFPALRMTSLDLLLRLLKDYGIYREEKHNKTSNTYTYKNNTMWFFSIDEIDKIKSTSFNYVWIEECNEISWEEFIVLRTRMRAPTKPEEPNQMFLSLNPSDSFGWVPVKLCGVTHAEVV